MKILAIDTSCDETAAAVTEGTKVLSNVIWSQALQHAQFGGVMPSLAQRMHRERIDWVISKAIHKAQITNHKIEAIAVTQGPGLAIALEVGIAKAKELAQKYGLPLIPVNHIEGHLLSPLAVSSTSPLSPLQNLGEEELKKMVWPALGLVISGGHTELILIRNIGDYKILAQTQDDALGEALDKAARMLGLGYPGGAVLEKMAKNGNPKAYFLPLPMARRENAEAFSYSGLKTAMWRLVTNLQNNPTSPKATLGAGQIYDLAATFQNRAFQHLIRICKRVIENQNIQVKDLLVGGGVAANTDLRKRLRNLGKDTGFQVRFPYSKKLTGDNAAMIGVAAFLRQNSQFSIHNLQFDDIDRKPRWAIDQDCARE
jgi:N6-L-threonylcarbamoyladenine synthase